MKAMQNDSLRDPNGNGFGVRFGLWSLWAKGRGVVVSLTLVLYLLVQAAIVTLIYRAAEEIRMGREAAVAVIRGDHRDLVEIMRGAIDGTQRLSCLLSMEVSERALALRSGDPCSYLLAVPSRRR